MTVTLDIDTMSVKEKIDLIGQLWNSIDDHNYDIPDWQMKILEARIQEDAACPDEGTPWEEFRSQLLNR
jgi:putative addiction module component (TIGR02574 family)